MACCVNVVTWVRHRNATARDPSSVNPASAHTDASDMRGGRSTWDMATAGYYGDRLAAVVV